jgi:hypothetical protein
MSRSYRKPYACVYGVGHSSRRDKQVASRSVRRTTDKVIKKAIKEGSLDELEAPLRYQCAHNNVWGWNRDGNATYQARPECNCVAGDRWPYCGLTWWLGLQRK